jgi:hypothetical protein
MTNNEESRRKYPPALTTEELAEISSSARDPLVRRLVWDVYRLRGLAVQAQQLLWTLENSGRYSPTVDLVMDSLRKRLGEEEVVKVGLVTQALSAQQAVTSLVSDFRNERARGEMNS